VWKIPPTVKDTGIATSAAGMARKKPKNEERGKLRQGKTSFLPPQWDRKIEMDRSVYDVR